MNEYLLKMLSIEKDIEKNSKNRTIIKSISVLCVFAVFFCSFSPKVAMNIAFWVSLPVIIVLFVIDSNFANKNHSLEVEIYLLELEHLKKEKEAKAENGDDEQKDWIDNIIKPDEKASLPIVFYGVLILVNIVIWIL